MRGREREREEIERRIGWREGDGRFVSRWFSRLFWREEVGFLFFDWIGGGETVISVMSGLLETCWFRFIFTVKTVDTAGNVAHKWGPRIT